MIVGEELITNMPNSGSKTRHIFAFLGVTESGTDANINILHRRLNNLFSTYHQAAKISRKGDFLILTLIDPDFCFYVAIVKNDSGEFPDWVDMAKNFGLPWDKKPLSAARLYCIIDILKKDGEPEYYNYREIGFSILKELEAFTQLKVFTIPSLGKRTIWYKLFCG